jgi:hypothetical protein
METMKSFLIGSVPRVATVAALQDDVSTERLGYDARPPVADLEFDPSVGAPAIGVRLQRNRKIAVHRAAERLDPNHSADIGGQRQSDSA